MAKYCGKNFLLQMEDQSVPNEFNTIGTIRDTTLSISNEQVDVTDKGSAPNRQLLGKCGINSMSISGAGLFSDDEVIDDLQAASRTGDVKKFKIISEAGDSYQGSFQIATFERNGTYNNAEEFSTSLESATEIGYNVDSDNICLLHMDDLALSDSSINGLATVKIGDTVRTSDQSVFGGFSMSVDGDDDGLDIGTPVDFATGTGAFTYEGFFRTTDLTLNNQCFEKYTSDGKDSFEFQIAPDGSIRSYFFNAAGARSDTFGGFNTTATGLVPLNTWEHIAWVFDESDLRVYVAGNLEKTYTPPGGMDVGANQVLRIGMGNNATELFGYADEIRVSKIARYTGSSFPVPTAPFN